MSVVIAAYSDERWEDLVRAARSALAQQAPALEVIVAVDGNRALLDRVRAELPEVRAVLNDGFPGAGGARNAGTSAAAGEIVAYIDDDVVAEPGWLAQQIDYFEDPAVLGVGGGIEPVWDAGRPRWFPPEFDWVVGCTYAGMPDDTAGVRNLIAANMSVRRTVHEALGGFRPHFGKLGDRSLPEETDFCIRAGLRWPDAHWLYVPAARVQHRVPSARGTPRYYVRRCWFEGLGKAELTALVGDVGVSAERDYALRVLPRGAVRHVVQGVRTRDGGIARAAALVGGFGVVLAGYATGRARWWRRDVRVDGGATGPA